ncbi:MAG: GHKL domain-containing protein [Ruminococcaceae bacterium]|nr:GHKL domain-containing protein [Oscillospiraceae bacterium]
MIQKLRKKFILISMAAFFSVLLVIISTINIVNYVEVVHEADELLTILSDNHGRFPKEPNGEKPSPGHMSPETPYESRFFSVVLDTKSDGVIQTETSRIFSVDQGRAIKYAREVVLSEDTSGFIDNYRFSVHPDGDHLRIIFLDCGRSLDSFYRFLLASLIISLLGFVVVFALIAFFSGRIIRPIVESYEKQKRFITDAGHELKTPLTIIHADTDVLEMEYGTNEWLDDIQKQTHRLSELTSHLVELARMEEAEETLAKVDIPLSDIISEAAESFITLAQAQHKTLSLEIEPMLTLEGNEKSLRQLVSLLLDNALKYSPEKGQILLTLQKQGNSIQFSVYNTTQSQIEKDCLPKLFDRFYCIDASHSSQTGGYGIGLSVAKAIVSAHNGKIQAFVDHDHSLRITSTFPL